MVNRDKDTIEEFVRDLLNDRVGKYQELSHLLYLWRTIPPEETGPRYPGVPTRERFLAAYISWTEYELWVWDVLRGFVKHLLEVKEPIPHLLVNWIILVFSRGGHVPKRGRPRKPHRNYHVCLGFNILLSTGRSREAAIEFIADELSSEEKQVATETIETIIKEQEYFTKHGKERSHKK